MKQTNSGPGFAGSNRLEVNKVTYKQLAENIGKTGILTVKLSDKDLLTLPVTIIDARRVFDRLDYRVAYNGQTAWTSSYNLKINQVEDNIHAN